MTQPTPLTAGALARRPLPKPDQHADKEARGEVLVIGSSARVPGAAMLTGVAALRAGAGKLRLAVPRGMGVAIGLAVPECGIIALPQDAQGEPRLAPALHEAVANAAAIVAGPGMMSPRTAAKLTQRLLELPRKGALILDAAALAGLPSRSKRAGRPSALIITPHHGEMAKLMDVPIAQVDRSPLEFARKAAARTGAIVVLKSKDTYVVTPAGAAWLHKGGHPGLATSGSGDVLAGLLAGLVARCSDPLTACLWAVVTHAKAGRGLGSRVGTLGFLARELLPEIPRLLGPPARGVTGR